MTNIDVAYLEKEIDNKIEEIKQISGQLSPEKKLSLAVWLCSITDEYGDEKGIK